MQESAPILHADLKTKEFGEQTGRVSNVAEHFRHVLGDIGKGFAEADVVVEREFRTATVHQGYIEPHNATVLWNNDGRVHVWCSTQGAFVVRDVTACVLDLPVSRVKVTPMEIGGGFGGKIPVYLEPVAALLSKKTGRPVKLVMSRKDVFEGTGPTPGSYIKVKMGAGRDGRITAAQAYLAYEAGAYPGAMVGPGGMCVFAAYDLANVTIDGFDVVVNKPSTAAYRAPGATNAAFATESVVDELADKLGIDPIEFRLKNAAKEGTRRADGPKYRRVGCIEVLQAMQQHPHYKAPLGGPNRGRGVAVGFWFNVGLASSCTISVNADGTVNLVEGSTDIGGTRTSIAMQAAEVLGIPAEDVRPTVVDTDSVGYTAVTGGSRTTFATGWAAYEAAQDVVRQMKERAAKLRKTDADSIVMDRETFRETAAHLQETGGPVVGRGAVNPRGVGGSFSGNIVDVEVDPETAKVTILRFTAVQDAGKAIHPSYVEGQMQGGSAQGIGWALNEEYYMSPSGTMVNSSLLDYRMPTALDLPMIDTVIVEVPNPGHPFGARGVGEANIVPPPGAIANAIYHAVGVRMNSLPMNPPKVMEAIWRQRD
jgi:CO/xanthine dehydrogenase Mo-binding subunit